MARQIIIFPEPKKDIQRANLLQPLQLELHPRVVRSVFSHHCSSLFFAERPSPTSVCLRLVCVGWELFPMYTATPHTLDMCVSDDRPVFSFQSMIFQYFSYLFHHALHFVTGGTLSKSFAKDIGTIFRGQTL